MLATCALRHSGGAATIRGPSPPHGPVSPPPPDRSSLRAPAAPNARTPARGVPAGPQLRRSAAVAEPATGGRSTGAGPRDGRGGDAGESRAQPGLYLKRFAGSWQEAAGAWAIDALINVVLVLLPFATTGPVGVFDVRPTWHLSQWLLKPTLFWCGVGLIVALFWAKNRALAASARAVEARIAQERAAERQATLNTLAATNEVQDALHAVYTDSLRRNTAELTPAQAVAAVQFDIRVVLEGLTTLASMVEPARPGARWGANIMRFVRIDPAAPALPPHIDAGRAFEGNRPLGEMRGVLHLDRYLSYCTEVTPRDRDPNLHDLTLCVPKEKLRGHKKTMLPGAPECFMQKQMLCINAEDIVLLCVGEEYDVGAGVGEKMAAYFRSTMGQTIQSILCHPLMPEETREPRGVLNLHSNYEGMFDDEVTLNQLYYLLRPATLVLLDLLDELETHEARLPVTPPVSSGGTAFIASGFATLGPVPPAAAGPAPSLPRPTTASPPPRPGKRRRKGRRGR